jgi:hypothetical protein
MTMINLIDIKLPRPENIEKSKVNNKVPFVRTPNSEMAKYMR